MIIDKQTLLSDGQAVTVTAASTNSYDFGAAADEVQTLNEKGQLQIMAQTGTDFAGGTSMSLAIQTDDSSTFASATTLFTTAAIAQAALVDGYKFYVATLPRIKERYLRAYFTVVGTMSAGTVHVGLGLDKQSNGR